MLTTVFSRASVAAAVACLATTTLTIAQAGAQSTSPPGTLSAAATDNKVANAVSPAEAVKTDPTKPEAAKTEAAKTTYPTADTAAPAVAPASQEPAIEAAKRAEPAAAAPETAKTEPAKSEPAKSEPAKAEAARSEPAKSEPVRSEPPASQQATGQPPATEPTTGPTTNAAVPADPAASQEPASAAAQSQPVVAPTETGTVTTQPATSPDAAAATSQPAVPQQAVTQPAAPAVDPVTLATRTWLGTSANTSKFPKDDVGAAVAFYEARTEKPLWVADGGFTANAKSAMDEVRKADDWGLSAAAFDLPAAPATGATPEALAEAEGKLTLELLKYVRFAKGGRVNPLSLSRILDMVPPLKDPAVVIGELAAASAPDTYLREQHPKYSQFQALRKALVKARGPTEPAGEIDPALKVSLPGTKTMLKEGVDAPEVALLRKRLKVPAETGVAETLFDGKLDIALKAFQLEKGLKPNGYLTGVTRKALNREVEATRAPDPGRGTQRLVLNMERWRWMPEDPGRVYVWNNIPEYMTRVMKDGETIFKEKIIVGMPQWATPVFSANMEFVGFNPSWGMPDGIKTRELQPRLRSAGGGFLFFGGGGGGSIIRAYGLNVYRGGKQIDPDSVDWGSADVRNYSFVQPPGGKNPLGVVKFRFPNKHDVYMHDTTERSLFDQQNRAMSHGCIRVQDPMRFAEIMLEEGNHLDAAGVRRAIAGGGEVTLKYKVPVHMTYFTAVADDDGHVSTFADLYGHDSKLSTALTGRELRLDPAIDNPVIDTSSSVETSSAEDAPAASNTKQGKKKKVYKAPDTLADAISGFWMN